MVANIEAVIEEARRYANEVRRHLPVEKVYLFGSYAKGTADELSDVDVAFFYVITEERLASMLEFNYLTSVSIIKYI